MPAGRKGKKFCPAGRVYIELSGHIQILYMPQGIYGIHICPLGSTIHSPCVKTNKLQRVNEIISNHYIIGQYMQIFSLLNRYQSLIMFMSWLFKWVNKQEATARYKKCICLHANGHLHDANDACMQMLHLHACKWCSCMHACIIVRSPLVALLQSITTLKTEV